MAGAGTLILSPVPETSVEASAPRVRVDSNRASRAALAAITLIVLAGAAIRFAALSRSIWFDEAVSVRDVSGTFGQMLHDVVHHEASPPFYFICLWVWRHLVGDSAVALRALSALTGTLTIWLAFYVARRRIGMRAGLVLATCVAVSPSLIYYSTEMRMYGLLLLLSGVGFEAFLRASDSPTRANLGVWAAMSVLAVWTQYFAALIVVPECALLLAQAWRYRPERTTTFFAVGGVVAGGAPLLYLLPYQAHHAFVYGQVLLSSPWQHDSLSIHTYPTLSSVAQDVVLGPGGPATGLVLLLSFLVVIVGAVWLRRTGTVDRGRALQAFWLLAPAVLIVMALVSLNLAVTGRYLLPLWLPVGLGVGYAASVSRLVLGLVAVLICVWAGFLIISAAVPKYATQDDVLGAAQSLGVAGHDRLIAVSQPWDALPFAEYRPQASLVGQRVVRVRELDVVAMPSAGEPPPGDHSRPSSAGLGPLPRGLRLAQVLRRPTFLMERFIASRPLAVHLVGQNGMFPSLQWRFLREPTGARMGSL